MKDSLSGLIRTGVQDVNKTVGNEYAIVTRVNNDKTVNVKLESSDSDDLINVPLAVDFDLKKDDKVILTYLDNNPGSPVVIGMINPQFNGSGENGRSVVSIDKVDSDGLADIYRITYDMAPIYSYFSVRNGQKGDKGDPGSGGGSSELSGLTVQHKVLVDSKIVNNVSSVEFDGLNGDEDGIYILEFNGQLFITDNLLLVHLNNDAANYKYAGSVDNNANTAGTPYSSTNGLILAGTPWNNSNQYTTAKMNILAKSGVPRIVYSNSAGYGDSYGIYFDGGGAWNNSTSNITSITLVAGNGTFSGTIKLYKLVDITYS
jgi:hypothetical protein